MKKKHKSKTIANVGTYKESHKSNAMVFQKGSIENGTTKLCCKMDNRFKI